LYVNQSDRNATDAVDNDGGNLNRPFKTIERALLEASKRSYVADVIATDDANDKFEAYTILIFPGDYTIDNRPGYGYNSSNELPAGFDSIELETDENSIKFNAGKDLYKFNPTAGGVIVPRGTSLVGYDLRKTVIRPLYVPDPNELTQYAHGQTSTDGMVGIMYDAANMIERNRGYIIDQARLYLEQSTLPYFLNNNIDGDWSTTITNAYLNLSQDKKDLCLRDTGLLIDAIVEDLRFGGNSNCFNVGEFYTDGVVNKFLNPDPNSNEVTSTVSTFQFVKELCIKAAHNWTTGTGTGNPGPGLFKVTTGTRYGYNEFTTGKTTNRITFSSNSFGEGFYADGDCTTVDSAVNILVNISNGIILNPSTYTKLFRKTLPSYEEAAIFKVTGGCYVWQLTFKDALNDPNYRPYKSTSFASTGIPTHVQSTTSEYSHHRVVSIAYADQRTKFGELETYYNKIDQFANTDPDYEAISDIRFAKVEEYQIVGDSSRRTSIDTVNSASPYIFNCSLRSVRGLCGMHTDGLRVKDNSFKSMVVAQFTGISLQKESDAYWQPRTVNGIPTSGTNPSDKPIYADPDAEYRPVWRHYHIKASNGAFIQVVSVFAVGYADQFLAVDGGDMSITNSNSNFGQVTLRSVGHQPKSFFNSSQGKITAVIPPRGISNRSAEIELYPIAASATWEANNQLDKYFQTDRRDEYLSEQQRFKLYLEIPNVNKEEDIPELFLESKDYQSNQIVVKRFLTYGANSNLTLFRDYYTFNGTTPAEQSRVNAIVENVSGGTVTYPATILLDLPFTDTQITSNNERVGYFWDDDRKKVYILVDGPSSRGFINNFVFANTTAIEFRTRTSVNSVTGEIVTTSGPETTRVLTNYDSFSSALTTSKFIDTRSSSPEDLLWRVEYTIPKTATNAKPPEKRFIIKGTRLGVDADGVPYTNYRLSVYDVKEIKPWIAVNEQDDQLGQDGVWYLTLLRVDIDKFVSSDKDSNINKTSIIKRQIRNGFTYDYDRLTEFYNNDIDYRVSSNVNYLYPSINEEGPTYNSRYIWNPPMTDSRCMVENIGSGNRVKDLSVPDKIYYKNTAVPTGIVITDIDIKDKIGIRLPIVNIVKFNNNSATITVRRGVSVSAATIDSNGLITLSNTLSQSQKDEIINNIVQGMTVTKTSTGGGDFNSQAKVFSIRRSTSQIQLFPKSSTSGNISFLATYPSFTGQGQYNLSNGNLVGIFGLTGDNNLNNIVRSISNVSDTNLNPEIITFRVSITDIKVPSSSDNWENAYIQLSEVDLTLNNASSLSTNQPFQIIDSSKSLNGTRTARRLSGNVVTIIGRDRYYNEIQSFIISTANPPESLTTAVTFVDTSVRPSGGIGARFTIRNAGGVYDVTMTFPGIGYSVNDVITIPPEFFGGDSNNETLEITINAVSENKTTGKINFTPFYHVPSMQSVTAEAVKRLVTSLNLRYVRFDDELNKFTSSTNTIDVVPVIPWDDRGWRSGFNVDSASNVYGSDSAYGSPEEVGSVLNFKFDSSKFNAFGYDADEEDRKILCVPPVSEDIEVTPQEHINLCKNVELYRPSILRASSHTWEYVGFGSGNYSTGFPNLQLRVLKGFEQYIVQGYENGGGFVASTGTNSSGDFYIGNQVIQAGGQSTFTLNVPKIRNSSESNFLDVSDIENRVSNSVVNITSRRNSTIQKLLKGLSNFFSTARLNVTDRATIANLTVTNKFSISNRNITNGSFFPEGNISGFGFTKAANPGKVGTISVDTNDRLYVSPKFLDAWRQKRQLLSASVSSADNNRVYLQSINSAQTGFLLEDLTPSSSNVKIRDASGFPASGRITVKMILSNTATIRKFGERFLSPNINITLDYSSVDYETGTFTLNSTQNGIPLSEYLGMILPPVESNYNTIIRNWDNPLDASGFTNSSAFIPDIRYLYDELDDKLIVSSSELQPTISITNLAKWNEFPDRGSLIVRRRFGRNIRYSVFEYVKSGVQREFNLVSRVSGNDENNYRYDGNIQTSNDSTLVFFGGCVSVVASADVWTTEVPFIPSLTELAEDVDIETATLYSPPDYPSVHVGTVDANYINEFVPNPVGSKALGVNLRNGRYVPVKQFKPLSTISQAAQYCRRIGFTPNDTVELIMKPGYYKIENSTFDCKIKINGAGVDRSQEILGKSRGEIFGRDFANVSGGNIAGYSQIEKSKGGVPSNDSVFFYRPINSIRETLGGRTDRIVMDSTQNINFKGGLELSNVHFLSPNEAIVKNEILDSDYSTNTTIRSARRRVRRAWNVKNSSGFPAESNKVEGGLTFLCKQTTVNTAGIAKVNYYIKNSQVVNNTSDLENASKTDCRFIEINLTDSNFTGTTGTPSNKNKFEWALNYIIPGTTIYLRSNNSTNVSIDADILSSSPKCRVAEVRIERDANKVATAIKIYVSVRNGDPDPEDKYSNVEDLDISNIGTGEFIVSFSNEDGDEYTTFLYNWSRIRREESLSRTFSISGSEYSYDPDTFDTPRIIGVTQGFKPGTYNLIIDNNPALSLPIFPPLDDGTFTAGTEANGEQKYRRSADGKYINTNKARYPSTTIYRNYTSAIIKNKTTSNEDSSVVIPYFPLGSQRTFGTANIRFQFIEVDISQVIGGVGNYNYNSTVTNAYANFTIGNTATRFNSADEYQIISRKNMIFAGSPFVDGDVHLPIDINSIERTGTSTCTVVCPSPHNLETNDIVSIIGTRIGGGGKLSFDGTYKVTKVNGETFTFIRSGKLNVNQNYASLSIKPIVTKSVGKQIFLNYPTAFRTIRKTMILSDSNTGSCGNFGTLIRVQDVPGSNRDFNINNVTFGAMSTYNIRDNTTGGGYHGGYIRSSGGNIGLESIRLRGNIVNNWSSIGSFGNSINPSRISSADARTSYGHCVDFLQTEESTRISNYNPDSSRVLTFVNTSSEDELYKFATDFTDKGQHFLEPTRNTLNKKIDYDSRVYPIKTNYALFRKKSSDGSLNTSITLNEVVTTKFVNYSASASGTSFAYDLRYNDSEDQARDSTGDPGSDLSEKTLTFICTDSPENRQEIAKINPDFTKIVNSQDPQTKLATVTDIEFFDEGDTLYVKIEYTGSINFNGYRSTDQSSNTAVYQNLQLSFITNQLETEKYEYITSLSSRYDNNVIPGSYSRLNFYSNVFSESPLMDVVKTSGIATAETPKTLRTFTSGGGAPPPAGGGDLGIEALIATNASGDIKELSIEKVNTSYNIGSVLTTSFNGCVYTMTIKENVSATNPIAMYEPGEYIIYPPSNCFIVNDIPGNSDSEIKREIQKIKSVVRPFSFIKIASPDVSDETYYKVAKDESKSPYIGVYRYINAETPNDIRAAIVIRLNNQNYSPKYRNGFGQHRFDVYELTSLLDKWPTTGKLLINEIEVADFTVNQSTRSLSIERSNTKYWPSYMHDFAGIDPENSENAGITAGDYEINVLKLLNPVDITSSTYRRIKPGTSTLENHTLTTPYISPTGIISSNITKVRIPSTSSSINEDFEKYAIGNLVSIPYKDISLQDIPPSGALLGPYNGITFTVQSDANVDSNKVGNKLITGTISATSNVTIANLNTTDYMIVPNSVNDSSVYNRVNCLGSAIGIKVESPTEVTTTNKNVVLSLEYALLDNISNGTQFKLVPAFNAGVRSGTSKIEIFKSRIIDIEKGNNEIILYLSDELPFSVSSGNYRHFGFILLNDGGWSYPSPGNSAYRPNNVLRGTAANTIRLPNLANKISFGDILTYTYETDSIIKIANGASGDRTFIKVNDVRDLQIGDQIIKIGSNTIYNEGAPDSEDVYIKDIIGNDLYLETYSGGLLVDYIATYSNEDKIIIKSGIPKIVTYFGTVSNVSSPTGGYSTVTLDTPTGHIITTDYPVDLLNVYASLSDITVVHTNRNFRNVGPVMNKFIYTKTGSRIVFDRFSVWNNWYSFRFSGKFRGNGPVGTIGWVGNLGTKSDTTKPIGIDSDGPLTIVWSRQRTNSLWMVAQPIRPQWSLSLPIHRQTASFSAIPSLNTVSWDVYLNTNLALPSYEENSQRYHFNPITHSTYTSNAILSSLNTASRHLTVESNVAPNYVSGGVGAYDTQTFKYGNILNVVKPKVAFQLQNAIVSVTNGNPTPGTGTKSRVVEMLVCDSVQHYQPVIYDARNNYVTQLIGSSDSITVTTTTSSPTVTITGTPTPIITDSSTFNAVFGDVLYIKQSDSYTLLGTIKSINFAAATITLTTNAKTAFNQNLSELSGRTLVVISPSGLRKATTGDFRGSPVTKGNAGGNVVGSDVRGYNTYNFAFNINRRNFNTTPLLNTLGVISSVSNKNFANLSIRNVYGDLCPFEWIPMNIVITRLNAKTHLENSTSISTESSDVLALRSIYI
jgi:hypothetical protein